MEKLNMQTTDVVDEEYQANRGDVPKLLDRSEGRERAPSGGNRL